VFLLLIQCGDRPERYRESLRAMIVIVRKPQRQPSLKSAFTRLELGCRAGQKFPVRSLFLPVHQNMEAGFTSLAIGD
jgi:hypothetical protein